jgi:hypothetical protein
MQSVNKISLNCLCLITTSAFAQMGDRQAWGNNEDAVYPSHVKSVRSAFEGRNVMWTVEELSKD